VYEIAAHEVGLQNNVVDISSDEVHFGGNDKTLQTRTKLRIENVFGENAL